MNIDDCSKDIFTRGFAVVALDACRERAEAWVQAVAKESGQRVDWHYSGGMANVLYLGDYFKVMAAVNKLEPLLAETPKKGPADFCRCGQVENHDPCQILQRFLPEAKGLYRAR